MFDKKFFDTANGVKQILAYELYVNHAVYQKDIASYLGCSKSSVNNYIKNISKYSYLNCLHSVIDSKEDQVVEALKIITSRNKLDNK